MIHSQRDSRCRSAPSYRPDVVVAHLLSIGGKSATEIVFDVDLPESPLAVDRADARLDVGDEARTEIDGLAAVDPVC